MCRRLIFLVSLVLVLALVSNASAAVIAYWNFDTGYTSIPNTARYSGTAVGSGVSIGTGAGEYKLGGGALKIDDDGIYNVSFPNPNYVNIPNRIAPLVAPQILSTSLWFKYSDISGDGSMGRNFLYEGSEDTFTSYTLSLGIRDDTDVTIGGVAIKAAQYYYQTGPPEHATSINNGYHPTDDGYTGRVDDDQWHHIVTIWNRAIGRIEQWVDNVATTYQSPIRDVAWGSKPDILGDVRTAFNGYPIQRFHIGIARAIVDERNWDGYIDDMAVFDSHLSAADIAYLWNGGAGRQVPEPATIALLGMGGLMLLRRKRRA